MKRTVLCNSIENGGLNMTGVRILANSLKTKWVKMYIDDTYRPWKLLFMPYIIIEEIFFIFCNFKKGDTSLSNCFIHEVCDTKASLSFSIPQRDFATQLVLNNNCIKINKQGAYFDVLKQRRWYPSLPKFCWQARRNRNFPSTHYYGITLAILSHRKQI